MKNLDFRKLAAFLIFIGSVSISDIHCALLAGGRSGQPDPYSFGYLVLLSAVIFLLAWFIGILIGISISTTGMDIPFEATLLSVFLGFISSLILVFSFIGLKWTIETGLPPMWKLAVVVLIITGILLSLDVEITGNILIDSLFVSLLVVGTAILVTSGLRTFFSLWFKILPVKIYLLLSALLTLLFRIYFWVREGTEKC